MPRRKHWRKSASKRRERSRTDESETTVTGKYTGSPEQLLRQGSPEQLLRQGSPEQLLRQGSPEQLLRQGSPEQLLRQGSPEQLLRQGSPGRNQAGSPEQLLRQGSPGRNQAGSPEQLLRQGSPGRNQAGSPEQLLRQGSPGRNQAGSPEQLLRQGSPEQLLRQGSPEQLLRQGSPGRNQAGSPEQLLRQGSPGRNQAGSPEQLLRQGSPGRNQAGSPEQLLRQGSPGRNQAGSPEQLLRQGSPGRNQAGSPEQFRQGSPKKQADLEKPVHSNKSDKLVQKEKVNSKNEEFQCSDFFKSLTASDSSNSQTSFDAVFMDTFPDVVANYQSRDKELSERERIAFCSVNTSQQNEELKRNVTAQHQLSSDPLEVCSDNDVACYQAIRSSKLLWNASDLVFGSFHQNDGRFSEHSRGYQCTCNALCMLSYAHCGDVDNSMVLDKVLYEGDALYQAVIRKLKSDGKFSQHLLSLEEIPDDFEVEIGKFTLEKFHIESGPLIDTQDLGLPTLHEVLQSAFLSVSSGLLTVGAICSAVFKKKGAYAFFDSHCQGHNGLSATDGTSSLITFTSLDDLVRYMYAFYDSMKLDTSMQYDFLPINVKKSQNKQSYKDAMASHIEAYFNDQRL